MSASGSATLVERLLPTAEDGTVSAIPVEKGVCGRRKAGPWRPLLAERGPLAAVRLPAGGSG
jgi:hypothetical protein